MSHFFTVVLVPKDTQNIEAKVEELLAPYDENIEVDEYDKECWCIDQAARTAGRLAAEAQIGPFEELRKSFQEKVRSELISLGIKHTDTNYWEKEEEVGKKLDWKAYIKAYTDYEDQITKQHFMFGKPTPDCGECEGTGTYKSTYNPASKWDWYVIGGRWDGVIQGQQRNSQNGFNFGEQHHQLGFNATPVSTYLKLCRDDNGQYPYSILTPMGEWCQKGEMGWFGIATDEKEDWKTTADKILEQYQDCIAVGVDCHI